MRQSTALQLPEALEMTRRDIHQIHDFFEYVRTDDGVPITDPKKIECDLMKIIPREHWTNWGHWLIWHGRRRCFARKPDCHHCEIFRLCPSGKVFVRSGQARPAEAST